MELVLRAELSPAPIDDDARRDYLEAHASDFALPERRSLELHHFGTTRVDPRADAEAARARLLAGGSAEGDPVLAAEGLGSPTEAELGRALGDELARGAFSLEEGVWSEPIATERGTWLVRTTAITPAALPELSRVSARIDAALSEERQGAALARSIDALAERWGVR
jgi:hypothetical protein